MAVPGLGMAERVIRCAAAPLHWLEQTRGRRRFVLVAVYAMLTAIVVPIVWRLVALRGLPDVGEPFDVAAYQSGAGLAAADDAAPLYEEAAHRLVPYRGLTDQGTISFRDGRVFQESPLSDAKFVGRWTQADRQVRTWVLANRAALDCWRRATARPAMRPPNYLGGDNVRYSLFALGLMEGARCEDAGERAEAWVWYRAALRSLRHLGSRSNHRLVQQHIERWAADSRTDGPLLRRARADVLALDAMPDRASDAIKDQYIWFLLRLKARPMPYREDTQRDLDAAAIRMVRRGYIAPPRKGSVVWNVYGAIAGTAIVPVDDLRRFVTREPERSRRVARLVFANWLANLDACHAGKAKVVPLSSARSPCPVTLLVPLSKSAPDLAGLTPAELLAWHESTLDAKYLLPNLRDHIADRAARANSQSALVRFLTQELDARKRREASASTSDSPTER